MHHKAGTVGHFLPDISYRFEPVEGIKEGGRLWVKGPNVMKGYLVQGEIISPLEGWYDTGDICELDSDSYLHLKGRAKRFGKIGGETISLTAVEEAVARLWPNHHHGVVARPDPKKGEHLVLYTTNPAADRATLISFWKEQGLSELSCPRAIHILASLPHLGSGKVDYRALEEESEGFNLTVLSQIL